MFLQHFKSLATDRTEYGKEDPNADLYDNKNALLNKAFFFQKKKYLKHCKFSDQIERAVMIKLLMNS